MVHKLSAENLSVIASSRGILPKSKSDVNVIQHKAQGGAIRAGSKSSENMQPANAPKPSLLARVADQLQKDAALQKEHSDANCQNGELKKPMPHPPGNTAPPQGSSSKVLLETDAKCISRSISDEGVGVATVPVGKNSQDASPCVSLHAVHSGSSEGQSKKVNSGLANEDAEKVNAKPSTSEPVSHHLQRGLTDFYLSYSNPAENDSEEYEVREIEPEPDYVGSSKAQPSATAHEPKGSAKVHESSVNSAMAVARDVTTLQQVQVSEVSGAEEASPGAKQGTTNSYVSNLNPVAVKADNSIDPVDETLTVTELDAVKERPGSPVERREET